MRLSGSNLLLSSLPPQVQATVARGLLHVDLPVRTTLYEQDEIPPYTYFLTSGLASVVAATEEGISAEVAMIGSEGLVGGLHVLGPATDPASCFMQTNGSGWRIRTADLASMLLTIPELRSRVLEYVQCYCFVLTRIACCNRLHAAEPRLARWLVMASKRLHAGQLPFTHDLLAMLVGANRPTVTLALGELQRDGIIVNARGKLSIPDPESLRKVACSCLSSVEARMEALYRAPL